ncbi:Lin1244/Lin1753 domain-containing protein [Lancefieldella rimae]|jgi:hypothetical protein|uniref:Lin1244/Lin1753-like N-terminal domain-containing protein n=2 Tax=Lancefieldella rimae TaxID=1383 RepID=B9CLL6_LANR4|nr:Lin1244/Lin1753 domain-containing protein [Lancefieldella rimae]EEE17413.1 hypothetical protein ATORI0001_1192 [Lancefieldella rimae ATCC 49626]KRO02183.1 hypothetical protein IV60_GL000604 [Lancefieldella rimae]
MKKQPLYDSDAMAARPLESFLHDSNAHDDMKIKRVRFRLGKEGVCTFWLLCEALALTDGHILSYKNDEDILTLMDYLWCQSFEEVEKNLSCFADVGLINSDSLREGKIVSERLLENALIVGKKRAAGAKAIAKRWSKKE